MSVFRLIREIGDIKRFKQIITVLFEEGFDILVEKIRLNGHIPFHKKLKKKILAAESKTPPARLRMAFERLGPTFIKLGQLLSCRPDLIPKEYVKEFEKLQDDVPPFPFDEVKKTIEEEFSKPITGIFSYFNKKPIAAASVSQVHEAMLKNGKRVAVKIQRPNIKKTMERDIDILFYLAHLIEKHIPESKAYSPKSIVEEFAHWTKRELNFMIEARSIDIFCSNFKDADCIKIPAVYWDYTTEKILTMEFIDGIKLSELYSSKDRRNKKKIAENAANALLKQIFIDGFFHADPHPGNIFVLKNNKIAFLDFGIVGRFSDEIRYDISTLLVKLVEKDIEGVTRILAKIAYNPGEEIDENKFSREVDEFINEWYGATLRQTSLSFIISELIHIAIRNKLKPPLDFVLFGKAILTIDNAAIRLDPSFNFVEMSRPIAKKIITERIKPKRLIKKLKKAAFNYTELVERFPERADRILRRFERGEIDVKIDTGEFIEWKKELDKSIREKSLGLVIAALIIGSALIMQIEKQPKFFDYPLGTLGYLLAIILTVWLIVSLIQKK